MQSRRGFLGRVAAGLAASAAPPVVARAFASLPPGTEVQRMGLADAVELTRSFLNPETT